MSRSSEHRKPPHVQQWQAVLNSHWPSSPEQFRDRQSGIRVRVRVVWRRDGEEYVRGTATRWDGDHMYVELDDPLADHLATYSPGNGGVVFSGRRGGPVDRSSAGDIWRTAVDGMGLRERSGWHELRHYHASLLIAEGLSVRAVADRLGHEDPTETLRTYSHLWPSDEDRAVAATEHALADTI